MRISKAALAFALGLTVSACSLITLIDTGTEDLQGHWAVVDSPPLSSVITGIQLFEADNMLTGSVLLSGRSLDATGRAKDLSFEIRTADPVMTLRGRLTGERSMRLEVSRDGESETLKLEKIDVIP